MDKITTTEDLTKLTKRLSAERSAYAKRVVISSGTCGEACGSLALVEAFRQELAKQGLADEVLLRVTGCHGFCEQEPLVIIQPGNVFYCHVSPEDVTEIVSRTVAAGEHVERLFYTDPVSNEKVSTAAEVSFYAAQDRVLIGQNEQLDPTSIDDYIANGGYAALAKVLTQENPEEVIDEVKASRLRGRGGGGFPTGRKWESCRAAANGSGKYVICNADEGDPGAYMDRSILEGNPHAVLEGMIVGAFAIGAAEGHVYVRNEYPLALEHIRGAVQQARFSAGCFFY